MARASIGIIGGSGLYRMAALAEPREQLIDTPFGRPSDAIVVGKVSDVNVAFLARHGRDHRLLPGEIPYRANIYALKTLGVRYLISISAVGSLREEIQPLDVVLPDQFIDLTKHRTDTFFGEGAVAHVSLANPVCPAVTAILKRACFEAGLPAGVNLHDSGTYVCIEGPAFSTRAESFRYRDMDASIIGMTAMPEARLAREAQMAYAVLAFATDYDCWHPRESAVTADLAIANLARNADLAQRMLVAALPALATESPASEAHRALESALVTRPEVMTPATRARLGPLLEPALPADH
jgi:5'-methylthioadenosine phosphorylase